MSTKVVHLVYIHGFRGDETTFQSFPTDLQRYLTSNIPSNLHHITLRSSMYPTYKSVKPISHATRNFLEWLSTQPPDPVILMCHSMGGLLGAEALVSVKPSRIIGMVAFDVPFLGMHPHVVINGIASLFPKDDRLTESQMNPDPQVKVVDKEVTDDWDNFKKGIDAHKGSSRSSLLRLSSPNPSRSPSPDVSFVDRALSFIDNHSNDPIVRWIRKHSGEPFTAGKRWVVENFQFGICMFDPSGLHERYTKLVAWKGGMWTNYWTQTIPRVKVQHLSHQQQIAENDIALLNSVLGEDVPIHSPTTSEEHRKMLQEAQKQKKEETKKSKEQQKIQSARHFIVLPTGLGQVLGGGDKWEKVLIEGVEDEVAAHCGLFIRSQNLDYDGFVHRVGTKLISWFAEL